MGCLDSNWMKTELKTDGALCELCFFKRFYRMVVNTAVSLPQVNAKKSILPKMYRTRCGIYGSSNKFCRARFPLSPTSVFFPLSTVVSSRLNTWFFGKFSSCAVGPCQFASIMSFTRKQKCILLLPYVTNRGFSSDSRRIFEECAVSLKEWRSFRIVGRSKQNWRVPHRKQSSIAAPAWGF